MIEIKWELWRHSQNCRVTGRIGCTFCRRSLLVDRCAERHYWTVFTVNGRWKSTDVKVDSNCRHWCWLISRNITDIYHCLHLPRSQAPVFYIFGVVVVLHLCGSDLALNLHWSCIDLALTLHWPCIVTLHIAPHTIVTLHFLP